MSTNLTLYETIFLGHFFLRFLFLFFFQIGIESIDLREENTKKIFFLTPMLISFLKRIQYFEVVREGRERERERVCVCVYDFMRMTMDGASALVFSQ